MLLSESDEGKLAAEDETFARIMSRLDVLEKEEEEACSSDEDNNEDKGFSDEDDEFECSSKFPVCQQAVDGPILGRSDFHCTIPNWTRMFYVTGPSTKRPSTEVYG